MLYFLLYPVRLRFSANEIRQRKYIDFNELILDNHLNSFPLLALCDKTFLFFSLRPQLKRDFMLYFLLYSVRLRFSANGLRQRKYIDFSHTSKLLSSVGPVRQNLSLFLPVLLALFFSLHPQLKRDFMLYFLLYPVSLRFRQMSLDKENILILMS